ncbi:MAG: hypothetical protein DME25_00235, partial [Verrucomicrobia bacterium]
MKPPPFLVGAALVFWGWQTGFLALGALMAVVLESANVLKIRWELSNEDFRRIWVFCALLFVAALVYAFSSHQGPADLWLGLLRNPGAYAQRNAGATAARTVLAWIRWLPMIFFLFVAAQTFSSREGVPMAILSLILSRRWKRAVKSGQPPPADTSVNVSYLYFGLCLFAASIHSADNQNFFWGLSALLAWGLWPQRSRRFGLATWVVALGAVIGLGYLGQSGLGRWQHYLESFNPPWLSRLTRDRSGATQSKTALGRIGRLKLSSSIVLRLEPKEGSPPPPLLREASYRSYKMQVWQAGSKVNTAAVNLACYLEGGQALLPLPSGCGRLENLPAYVLQKNRTGAVLAEGPGLVMFDAHYGPGATLDALPTREEDCRVPPNEAPALDQVLGELHLTGDSTEHALRTLRSFFQREFSYRT